MKLWFLARCISVFGVSSIEVPNRNIEKIRVSLHMVCKFSMGEKTRAEKAIKGFSFLWTCDGRKKGRERERVRER